MQQLVLRNIEGLTFRANPNYELLLFDRLSSQQQEMLAGLEQQQDFYGVLRPKTASRQDLKSVGHDTALLWFTLQEPSKLPRYVKTMLGSACNEVIAELVLDGVLEVEAEGGFVNGADAHKLLYGGERPGSTDSVTALLSVEAVKCAQRLHTDDPLLLSSRLYFFNRVPLSHRWRCRFPGPDAVARYLGFQPGGKTRPLLDRHWAPAPPETEQEGWFSWHSLRHQRSGSMDGGTYKLYISPESDYFGELFPAALEVLSTSRAFSFKVGRNVYGLLRPDKFVAYFATFEALAETADRLQRHLEGYPAQGVPFTAPITTDGLLSWGIDPDAREQLPLVAGQESWRSWLTSRLAVALLTAKDSRRNSVEPWRYAIDRLGLEGVDTATWTPLQRQSL